MKFLQVCVCPQGRGGCLPQCMLGCQTPPGPGRPPRDPPPRDHADTPPRTRQTPPRDQADDPPRPGRHPPDQADPPLALPPGPGRHPPRTRQTPPPWDQADTPPDQADPPPRREADSSIRPTSGRYASYWNAFLFSVRFVAH